MRRSSGCVLSASVFITCSEKSYIKSLLNCTCHGSHTSANIAQPTLSGRGPFPAVNEEDVIIILHQQQTMHVAHNIPNTVHTFSEGTQKGSLCTYSALCSITCCMNPQLGNITCIFENLCVARCRHDYGLRTSLAKEVKGQMSIVAVFNRRFGSI